MYLFCTYKFAVGSVGKKVCYLVAGSCCSSYQECGRNELRRHRESNQCSRRKGECVEILRFQNTIHLCQLRTLGMIRNVLCPVLSGRVILLTPAWEKLQLRYVTLPWLKISGSQQIRGLAMAEKKRRKKTTCMTFLCMIALRNNTAAHTFYHRWTMLMSVSVKKDSWDPEVPYKRDCYLGNVTSLFSSLLSSCLA